MTTQAQARGLGQFTRCGFTLEHDGAIGVFLIHKGELVARFSQTGANEKTLQAECARHLTIKLEDGKCLTRKEEK